MDEELIYLNEKIDELETRIDSLDFRQMNDVEVIELENEKQILENILSYITIKEIEK